jgi:hypothetical protein
VLAQYWLLPSPNNLADDDPESDHKSSEDTREQLVIKTYQIIYIVKELPEPNCDWIMKELEINIHKIAFFQTFF